MAEPSEADKQHQQQLHAAAYRNRVERLQLAAAALNGLLANHAYGSTPGDPQLADHAVRLADMTIEVLNKPVPK